MKRIYSFKPMTKHVLGGRPLKQLTNEFVGWSRPGTASDRQLRRHGDASRRMTPADTSIRQQRRASLR